MAGVRVVVRLQFEGVHSWPQCYVPEVEFLRHPHRHVFHVEAVKAVDHGDRQVEIIAMKRALEAYCCSNFDGPHTLSCEQMAERLVSDFDLVRCLVLEDGENGAEVVS